MKIESDDSRRPGRRSKPTAFPQGAGDLARQTEESLKLGAREKLHLGRQGLARQLFRESCELTPCIGVERQGKVGQHASILVLRIPLAALEDRPAP